MLRKTLFRILVLGVTALVVTRNEKTYFWQRQPLLKKSRYVQPACT